MRLNRKKVTIYGFILFLCLVVVFRFVAGVDDLDKSTANGSKRPDQQSPPRNDRVVIPARDPRIDEVSKTHAIEPSSIRTFVEDSGDSAEAISWAYLLTHDPSYIEKLKNHADSELALQLLAQFDVGAESRLYWAEKLNKKDPANGLGKLLMARAFLESGKPDTAINAFAEAVEAEHLSSPVKTLKGVMPDLLKRVPASRTTAFAIHDVISAQVQAASDLFPWSYAGLFENKSQEEARLVAMNILKLADRLTASESLELLHIQGFSELRNATEGARIGLLVDFERHYGEGSSKSINHIGLQDLTTQLSAEANRIRAENKQLTPEQVDARVQNAIVSIP